MVSQTEFTLRPRTRGFHLITDEVVRNLPPLPQTGLLYLFIKHTSAALSINENADPDVRTDMESIFNHLIKEREPYYEHTLEGWDDMPAHAKATIIGVSLTIPITEGRLNMGIWQGIYLCEFRNHGGGRKIVATCFYSRKGNENPFTGEKQVSVNEFINYERQSINEKAQITQGAFDSFVCGCTHTMDPRANRSFNSQDNAWSSDQEH